MEITTEMKKRLADLISDAIKTDFEYVHLSGNLMDSIEIHTDLYTYTDQKTGKLVKQERVVVDIPAPTYNKAIFFKTGALVYNGKGSYASTVNRTGGFSKQHKNYVERAIQTAVSVWLREYNLKGKIS